MFSVFRDTALKNYNKICHSLWHSAYGVILIFRLPVVQCYYFSIQLLFVFALVYCKHDKLISFINLFVYFYGLFHEINNVICE